MVYIDQHKLFVPLPTKLNNNAYEINISITVMALRHRLEPLAYRDAVVMDGTHIPNFCPNC